METRVDPPAAPVPVFTRLPRRLLARAALLAALVVVLVAPVGCFDSGGPTAPAKQGSAPTSPGPTNPEVVTFVTLVNQHRASLGLPQLAWRADLAAVAQAHSQDMVDRGFFAHTNPDGETPWDRMHAAGITFSAGGENIAYGYPTAAAVFAGWMSSPGHKANIENPNFTQHGVGLVGTYWTHDFIRP